MFNTFRFVRVGSVVLALHDATDVFLEIGKMSKYSGAETMASIAFLLFVVFFTLLRIICYPFWVLRSTRFAPSLHFFFVFSFLLLSVKIDMIAANLGELYEVPLYILLEVKIFWCLSTN